VERLIGSNIALVTEMASDLALVKADATQIGQVVLNLVANAKDAMPEGGTLIVATANARLDEASTRQHADVRPRRYVLLSISDTGAGMPEGVLTQAFEPFFTTKSVRHGTGLGLATVYGIVNQSDGHLEVATKVGQGTTVRVFLPLSDEPQPPPDLGHHPLPAKRNETILLVEDNALVRQITSRMLARSGYAVLEAADGMEALTLVEQHQGPIDLLLTDLVMPHWSGREVAERVLSLRPDLPVLYMSGYTEDAVVQQGVAAATVDFLPKPFSIKALTNKVGEVLDRSRDENGRRRTAKNGYLVQ